MDSDERTRRRFLTLVGLGSVTSVAGCASFAQQADSDGGSPTPAAGGSTPEATTTRTPGDGADGNATGDATQQRVAVSDVEAPDLGVAGAPVPSGTASTRYATMGTADPTLTVYGAWKCPYTEEFVRNQFGSLVREFVEPGDVSVRFRAAGYENGEPYLGPGGPLLTQAGLAVWDIDPASYWSYFSYVFANQPREERDWGTMENVATFARRADVRGIDQVRRAVESKAYAQSLQATVDRANELGVDAYPRVAYDGALTAPTRNPERTRRQFERAASDD